MSILVGGGDSGGGDLGSGPPDKSQGGSSGGSGGKGGGGDDGWITNQGFRIPNQYLIGIRVYDVGQGNGIGILAGTPQNRFVVAFVDIGGSSSHNASSWLADLQAGDWAKPVILTHWHNDHYRFFAAQMAHVSQVLVPVAARSQAAAHFAAQNNAKILPWGGGWQGLAFVHQGPGQRCSLLIVKPSLGYLGHAQHGNKNLTGLTVSVVTNLPGLAIDDPDNYSVAHLPGDDSLHLTPSFVNDVFRRGSFVLTAFHHGSHHEWGAVDDDTGLTASETLVRDSGDQAKNIVYSFKTGNRYGHPHATAVERYETGNWTNVFSTNILGGGFYDILADGQWIQGVGDAGDEEDQGDPEDGEEQDAG